MCIYEYIKVHIYVYISYALEREREREIRELVGERILGLNIKKTSDRGKIYLLVIYYL